MSGTTCATCKWWTPVDGEDGWGRCGRIDFFQQLDGFEFFHGEPPADGVLVSVPIDPELTRGVAKTWRTVGCNLHEAAE